MDRPKGMKQNKITDSIVEELEAFSSGTEHIHASVGPIVLSLMKQAYNKGRKDENEDWNPADTYYYGVSKRKTFNQWIKKKFKA